MLFLVDGCNVTKSDPALEGRPDELRSESLASRLDTGTTRISGRGRVLVVFDGAGRRDMRRPDVEVRFSGTRIADDVITDIALSSTGPLTVVTNDRDLIDRIRRGRPDAEFMTSDSLHVSARPAKRRSLKPSSAGMPKGANKITEELKHIWLDEKD